ALSTLCLSGSGHFFWNHAWVPPKVRRPSPSVMGFERNPAERVRARRRRCAELANRNWIGRTGRDWVGLGQSTFEEVDDAEGEWNWQASDGRSPPLAPSWPRDAPPSSFEGRLPK